MEERYLKDLVGFGTVRNLRDAENYLNSLNFLFEFVNLFFLFCPSLIERLRFRFSLIQHPFVGNSNSNVTFQLLI